MFEKGFSWALAFLMCICLHPNGKADDLLDDWESQEIEAATSIFPTSFQQPGSDSSSISQPADSAKPTPAPRLPTRSSTLPALRSSETNSSPSRNLRSLSSSSFAFTANSSTHRNSDRGLHPQMFADSPTAGLSVVVNDGLIATSDLPIGAGVRRLRVASDNRALPDNRLIFSQQTYFNALTADASQFIVDPDSRTIDLEHYTIGFEKTFLDGRASIDIRSSFANALSLDTPNFGVTSGTIGNINSKFKFLLFAEEASALSVGLGLEAPTGSDTSFQGNGLAYELRNDAWFLQPFLAYEERFERWFLNGFLSTDVPLNGNELRRTSTFIFLPPFRGQVNDQTLLISNIGLGRWLWRNSSKQRGLATMLELNYATTLQDTDVVEETVFIQTASVLNRANRSDTLNLGTGLHGQLGNWQFRGGFIQPLRTGDDRTFSQEANFQVNRLF